MTDEEFGQIRTEIAALHAQDDERRAFVATLRDLADEVEDGRISVERARFQLGLELL